MCPLDKETSKLQHFQRIDSIGSVVTEQIRSIFAKTLSYFDKHYTQTNTNNVRESQLHTHTKREHK